MKKLIAYCLGIFACAWLIHRAISLLVAIWPVLALGGVVLVAGWFTFHKIKTKDWR